MGGMTIGKLRKGYACRKSALAAVFAVLAGCAEPQGESPVAEPVRAIKYQVVGEGLQAQTRRLSGRIQARESSQLSFQVSGQVLRVPVSVGSKVTRGDLIAELDPKPYDLRRQTAVAELASAESVWRERQENYLKQQRIFKRNYISRSELDRALTDYEKARSAVELARSRLELAERDLRNTRLVAPFDGVINGREVEPFEDVPAGRPVFEIQGDAGFEVALLLPGRLLSFVEQGSSATVSIPSLVLDDMPGVVTELGLRSDGGGAYPLTVDFDHGHNGVQAGMTAQVTLRLQDNAPAPLLPGSAILVGEAGERFVYRYDATASVVRRVPVTLHVHDLDAVAVDSGLAPGDIVAVAGVEFLRDGQTVELYEPPR